MKPARKNGGRNSMALDGVAEADATADGGGSADAGNAVFENDFFTSCNLITDLPLFSDPVAVRRRRCR